MTVAVVWDVKHKKIVFSFDVGYFTDKGGDKGGRGQRDDGGPDRTDSDWRRPMTNDSCELNG